MVNSKAILLLSGGIDSTNLLAWLHNEGKEIYALSFDYGQKHKIELEYAIANAKKFQVKEHRLLKIDNSLFKESNGLTNPELKFNNSEENANPVVPARNTIFISYALSFAETINCSEIYLAFNSDDSLNFKDCSKTFVTSINSLIQGQSNLAIPPRVIVPFIEMSKVEMIELTKKFGISLEQTISCYQPEGNVECGVCLSCQLKLKAIEESKI